MKKSTKQKHTKIANDIMYYIYKHIDTDINIDELSFDMNISRFHMQRLFKEEFNQNIYESIKSIRLQKASSLLLTNRYSTISEIAKMCGYSSQGAFIKVFKQKFLMTPKEWRKDGYKEFSQNILNESSTIMAGKEEFSHLVPTIVKIDSMQVYYIRHKGYNKTIKQSWQKLQTWLLYNNIKNYKQVGIHHDNPVITALSECRYIASIVLKEEIKDISLPTLQIPGGVYARFDFSGKYGDILKFMSWVYFEWLIQSGYETTTNPSFAIYEKNHFLQKDETFKVQYHIPICYI